jgi:hypothetical protein
MEDKITGRCRGFTKCVWRDFFYFQDTQTTAMTCVGGSRNVTLHPRSLKQIFGNIQGPREKNHVKDFVWLNFFRARGRSSTQSMSTEDLEVHAALQFHHNCSLAQYSESGLLSSLQIK